MPFSKDNPGKGRPPGSANKATVDARTAIAAFVDNNAQRLEGWLDTIAEGVKNSDGAFIKQPDPEKAFNMVKDILEYHVPKLARTEHAGDNKNPVKIDITWTQPPSK